MSQFEERQLTGTCGDTYPLIIRLECVSDKGKTENHQLQVSHPIDASSCRLDMDHVFPAPYNIPCSRAHRLAFAAQS